MATLTRRRLSHLVAEYVRSKRVPSFGKAEGAASKNNILTAGLPMDTRQVNILKERIERFSKEKRLLREALTVAGKEKRTFQKRLRESMEILRLVPGAIVVIQGGKIILTNDAFRDQLGYLAEELLDRNFAQLVHPDSARFVKMLEGKKVSVKTLECPYEIYLVTSEGKRLCYDSRVNKIRYRGRKAFLINMLEIEQAKKAEIGIRYTQRMDSLIRMASGLSRELKGCLGVLVGEAGYVRGAEVQGDTDEIGSAKGVEAAYKKGHLVLKQLNCLTATKYDASDLFPVDIKQLVQDAINATRPKWEMAPEGRAAKIEVRTSLRPISPVRGHPQEIRNVFESIILNAVDALPEGGEIYVSTEEYSGFAHVYFQDHGVGIKGSIKDMIFDPFFTTKPGSVQGLGLSLCRAVVTRHGGEIEFISQKGQGTTFTVKFPLAQEVLVSKRKNKRTGIKNSHVLVIADEEIVQDLLFKSFLKKGARVSGASTAKEVFKLLKKNKFDLIIESLDKHRPEHSSMVPKIKQMGHDLPTILVSHGAKTMSLKRSKDLGVDLVVGRPLEMDKILSFFTTTLALKGRS